MKLIQKKKLSEEAKDIALDDGGGILYSEYNIDNVEEIDEFVVDLDI